MINLIYALALVLLGMSSDVPDLARGVSDYVAHALASGIHVALLFMLLRPPIGFQRAVLLAAGCASLYGGIIETLQLLQPARTVETADLAANTIGACLVALTIYLVGDRPATGVER
jgi:VanZ family protein